MENRDLDTLEIGLPLGEGLSLPAKIEAVIFASQRPLKTLEIFDLVKCEGLVEDEPAVVEAPVAEFESATPQLTIKDIQDGLDELVDYYRDRAGGFTLRYAKGLGYQFQTVPAAAKILERQFAQRPRPISRAALETLSIIAYRQPCTRAEVEYIRGVDAGSIIKNLLERDLIACVGRKEIAGRPMLFGTTAEFLKVFQLSNVKDLPSLESFQPSHEALQKALEKLEQGEQPVDVEDYIGESPEKLQIDEDHDANPVETSTDFDASDFKQTADDADSEVFVDGGDLLPEGSRDLDHPASDNT